MRRKKKEDKHKIEAKKHTKEEIERAFRKNWNCKCMCCDQSPTVGDTDLCGPCCFGESDTINGNW